jgi:hypothetical protein
MLRCGVRPSGCRTPHSASLLLLAPLAPTRDACSLPSPAPLVACHAAWIRRLYLTSRLKSRRSPRPRAHPPDVATTEACASNELRIGDLRVTLWHQTPHRRWAPCRRAFCNYIFHAFQMYMFHVFRLYVSCVSSRCCEGYGISYVVMATHTCFKCMFNIF